MRPQYARRGRHIRSARIPGAPSQNPKPAIVSSSERHEDEDEEEEITSELLRSPDSSTPVPPSRPQVTRVSRKQKSVHKRPNPSVSSKDEVDEDNVLGPVYQYDCLFRLPLEIRTKTYFPNLDASLTYRCPLPSLENPLIDGDCLFCVSFLPETFAPDHYALLRPSTRAHLERFLNGANSMGWKQKYEEEMRYARRHQELTVCDVALNEIIAEHNLYHLWGARVGIDDPTCLNVPKNIFFKLEEASQTKVKTWKDRLDHRAMIRYNRKKLRFESLVDFLPPDFWDVKLPALGKNIHG